MILYIVNNKLSNLKPLQEYKSTLDEIKQKLIFNIISLCLNKEEKAYTSSLYFTFDDYINLIFQMKSNHKMITKINQNSKFIIYIYKLMFIIRTFSSIIKLNLQYSMCESRFYIGSKSKIYSLYTQNKKSPQSFSVGFFLLNQNLRDIINCNTKLEESYIDFLNINILSRYYKIKSIENEDNNKKVNIIDVGTDITYVEYCLISFIEDFYI